MRSYLAAMATAALVARTGLVAGPGHRQTMDKPSPGDFLGGVAHGAVAAVRLALRIVVFGLLALVAYVWSRSVFL